MTVSPMARFVTIVAVGKSHQVAAQRQSRSFPLPQDYAWKLHLLIASPSNVRCRLDCGTGSGGCTHRHRK